MIQNVKRNWIVISKLRWKIWRNFTRALENLKNLLFNELLLTKVYNVWSKKVQKWHAEFATFSPQHSVVLKLGLWWDPFIQCRQIFELKIYKGATCHDNEEWCKMWRGIDLPVQNWPQEFDEFWPKHSKT